MGDITQMFGQPFDNSKVEPSTSYNTIPAGWYPASIEKACVKPTRKGNGHFIAIQWSILTDTTSQFTGKKLFTNLNINNPSAKAVEIGAADLSAITKAICVGVLEDCSQLIGQVCEVRVIIKDGANETKGYRALGSNPGGKDTPAVVPKVDTAATCGANGVAVTQRIAPPPSPPIQYQATQANVPEVDATAEHGANGGAVAQGAAPLVPPPVPTVNTASMLPAQQPPWLKK